MKLRPALSPQRSGSARGRRARGGSGTPCTRGRGGPDPSLQGAAGPPEDPHPAAFAEISEAFWRGRWLQRRLGGEACLQGFSQQGRDGPHRGRISMQTGQPAAINQRNKTGWISQRGAFESVLRSIFLMTKRGETEACHMGRGSPCLPLAALRGVGISDPWKAVGPTPRWGSPGRRASRLAFGNLDLSRGRRLAEA